MTDKELRRLKRPQLIEILYYLHKEVDRLKQENEELKQRLEVDKKIPEELAKQIEQIVHRAVKGYPDQKPPEISNAGKKNNGDNGEHNDADQ